MLHDISHRRPGTFTVFAATLAILAGASASPAPVSAQVRSVAEMTSPEIAALDRTRTVVLLPGGILEEHGPWLPTFADGYLNDRLAGELASAIGAAKPGWTVLVFPTVPLGNSGANDVGGRYSFPGTFGVRNHSRALDDAGDYFHATFGGRMVHLAGLMSIFSAIEGPKPEAAKQEEGLPIHSGMDTGDDPEPGGRAARRRVAGGGNTPRRAPAPVAADARHEVADAGRRRRGTPPAQGSGVARALPPEPHSGPPDNVR